MKIQIGITTFNRVNVLRAMAESLRRVEGINECDVRIYDDCSTAFNVELLYELFPFASSIVFRSNNLGADMNTFLMYQDFVDSDNDILFNVDSDLIFHADSLNVIKQIFSKTDGVLSLYNSNLHQESYSFFIDAESVCEKKHIGAAGAVFSKPQVKLILLYADAVDAIDWRFSAIFNQFSIRILSTSKSYVQHIGLAGQNCSRNLIDFGVNFECGHSVNERILLNCLQEHLLGHNEFMSSVFKRYRTKFNKRLILILLALVVFNIGGFLFVISYYCRTIFN